MADPISLVPMPQSVTWNEGIWSTENPWDEVRIDIDSELPKSEHRIVITPEGATLTAGSESALADARNAFSQIVMDRTEIPCLEIRDRPAYPWRGLMIDVARHFLPLHHLRVMIDAMALHRLNILHLHLTDDQGWRMEVKGYPALTDIGSHRRGTMVGQMTDQNAEYDIDDTPHSGYYTQQELKDLVVYAQDRGITIVPEIDLPGHMQAAVASYPELGTESSGDAKVREIWGISDHVLGTNDTALTFVRDVLTQVADIFPAPFVHIGGDECPTDRWQSSPQAHERLAEWGLDRIDEIQGHFTCLAADVLRERDRRVIGWDEVLETRLPDDMVIMNWRGENGLVEALRRGFQTVIATRRPLYLDAPQASPSDEPLAIRSKPITLKDTWTTPLLPEGLSAEEKSLILGVQAQLWTEYIPNADHLQYMAFPRLCAIAERAWGSKPVPYKEFLQRLEPHLERLDSLGITYRSL